MSTGALALIAAFIGIGILIWMWVDGWGALK